MISKKRTKRSHAARKAVDGNKRKALSRTGNKTASSASSQSTKLPTPARTKVTSGTSLQDMKSGAIFGRIARTATQRAWTVIVIFILLASMGVGLAVTKLRVDTNPALMISNELEFRQQYDTFIKQFPTFEENFLFVVESDDPSQSRQAAEKLEKKLLSRPDLFLQVVAPGVGEFFDEYGVLYAKPDEVKKVTDQIRQSAPAFNALAENPNIAGLSGVLNELSAYTQAGRAPEGADGFINAISDTVESAVKGGRKPLDWTSVAGSSDDGVNLTEKRWFVFSQPVLNFADIEPVAAPMAEARRLLTDPELTGNGAVTIKLTGYTALNAEEFEAVTKGAAIAGIISFTLVSLIVFFGLPTLILVVPALGLIVLGFLINAGFATLSVGYLNMISVAFAVLFIGLGIDYAIHVILRFSEYRAKGQSGADAAVSSVEKTGPALALCTITTALAFLAFTPTDFVGMAQLGIIAAGGMVIAFVASITLVPAILTLLPGKQHKYDKNMASLSSV
ncbi:MAG: MMPL family transporter, partial [Anderseniella sp.]